MNSLPEETLELVDFPDPRLAFPDPRLGQAKPTLTLRPSIGTILKQMNPNKVKSRESTVVEAEASQKRPIIEEDDDRSSLEREKAELREEQRQFARTQADSLERIRIARELELLLAARESVLDNREALISSRLADSVPDQKISAMEKALNDSRDARLQANQALTEMESIIASLRTEIEEIKSAGTDPEPQASEAPANDYEAITDKSLEEQVAFLQEREAFIEQSENVLFEKAQHLQEWETRLEQKEHDGEAGSFSVAS